MYCIKYSYHKSEMYVFVLDIIECNSNPCGNSGTCIDKVNRYTCICAAGYTGTNCETGMSSKILA